MAKEIVYRDYEIYKEAEPLLEREESEPAPKLEKPKPKVKLKKQSRPTPKKVVVTALEVEILALVSLLKERFGLDLLPLLESPQKISSGATLAVIAVLLNEVINGSSAKKISQLRERLEDENVRNRAEADFCLRSNLGEKVVRSGNATDNTEKSAALKFAEKCGQEGDLQAMLDMLTAFLVVEKNNAEPEKYKERRGKKVVKKAPAPKPPKIPRGGLIADYDANELFPRS